jgi:hypothetical protein
MYIFAQTKSPDETFSQARQVFERVGDSIFNGESIIIFIISLAIALIAGRIIAAILRKLTKFIGLQADKTEDLNQVNRLRRIETLIILSIALIRTILIILALYFWWTFTHSNQQSTAILGAGALLTIILSGALFNTLRDVASGSVMMAEHWFGVGDHIRIEPLPDVQGVVERVTLRSTKLRKVTGEIIWINNKDIIGVSVTPKGVRTIAIELYAKDVNKAIDLVDDANLRLPQGALTVVSPLSIMIKSEVAHNLWHITAIAEVAPGREWMLDKFAVEIIKELDEKYKTLAHEPLARYADSEAERRFARAIHNARKSKVARQSVVKAATRSLERSIEARRLREASDKPRHKKKQDTSKSNKQTSHKS